MGKFSPEEYRATGSRLCKHLAMGKRKGFRSEIPRCFSVKVVVWKFFETEEEANQWLIQRHLGNWSLLAPLEVKGKVEGKRVYKEAPNGVTESWGGVLGRY